MSAQFSDPNPSGSSESSNAANSSQALHAPSDQSDEDGTVLLAESHPKKRAGRKIFKETRHPVYRGVRKRNNNRWVCEAREPNKQSRIWLGTYPTPEMAARAHDVAALAFRGKSACLNFADSAWRLPAPVSMEAKDIRRAATEAAEMFRFPVGNLDGEEEQGRSEKSRDGDRYEARGNMNECGTSQENGWFVEQELVYDMTKGPLFSPPRYAEELDGMEDYWQDEGTETEVVLWNY